MNMRLSIILVPIVGSVCEVMIVGNNWYNSWTVAGVGTTGWAWLITHGLSSVVRRRTFFYSLDYQCTTILATRYYFAIHKTWIHSNRKLPRVNQSESSHTWQLTWVNSRTGQLRCVNSHINLHLRPPLPDLSIEAARLMAWQTNRNLSWK